MAKLNPAQVLRMSSRAVPPKDRATFSRVQQGVEQARAVLAGGAKGSQAKAATQALRSGLSKAEKLLPKKRLDQETGPHERGMGKLEKIAIASAAQAKALPKGHPERKALLTQAHGAAHQAAQVHGHGSMSYGSKGGMYYTSPSGVRIYVGGREGK